MSTARSAGVLLYRWAAPSDPPDSSSTNAASSSHSSDIDLEVYLVHPGGPYFRNKDAGYWGLAKGLIENGENVEAAARREFAEETGFRPPVDLIDLGSVTTHYGKIIHGFAGEWTNHGEPSAVTSNTCAVEWPPRSGVLIDVPEVDEGRFFSLEEAQKKMIRGQVELIGRLMDALDRRPNN